MRPTAVHPDCPYISTRYYSLLSCGDQRRVTPRGLSVTNVKHHSTEPRASKSYMLKMSISHLISKVESDKLAPGISTVVHEPLQSGLNRLSHSVLLQSMQQVSPSSSHAAFEQCHIFTREKERWSRRRIFCSGCSFCAAMLAP